MQAIALEGTRFAKDDPKLNCEPPRSGLNQRCEAHAMLIDKFSQQGIQSQSITTTCSPSNM